MTTETHTHTHRYRFPEPSGPVAIGECACGATQTGRNRFLGDEEPSYNRPRPAKRGQGTMRPITNLSSHLTAEERLWNDYRRSLRGTSKGKF